MEPHSLVEERGKVVILVGAWPAASKTNASWPAHQLGRAGEVIHRQEEKTGTRMVTFCLLPKGTCPRPQPAQPVGGPLRIFQCEGRRPGTKKEVQPPPIQPHQRRGSRGRNLLPGGSVPHFFPRNGAPAGQAPFPAVPTAGRPQQGPGFQPPAGLSSRETKKSPPHTRQGLM